MPGIITVTFNPAIDKSTTISSLAAEKKLRCSQPHFEPGGGGLNVARASINLAVKPWHFILLVDTRGNS